MNNDTFHATKAELDRLTELAQDAVNAMLFKDAIADEGFYGSPEWVGWEKEENKLREIFHAACLEHDPRTYLFAGKHLRPLISFAIYQRTKRPADVRAAARENARKVSAC